MTTRRGQAMTAAMQNLEDVWTLLTRPPERELVATAVPTVFLRFVRPRAAAGACTTRSGSGRRTSTAKPARPRGLSRGAEGGREGAEGRHSESASATTSTASRSRRHIDGARRRHLRRRDHRRRRAAGEHPGRRRGRRRVTPQEYPGEQLRAERVAQLLDDARLARDAGDWAGMRALATAALALDSGNSEAEALLAAASELRQISLLFCDMVDSTAIAETREPEDVSAIMRGYRDACARVVERFGGSIEGHRGDGMFVRFGYPEVHPDDARRAVLSGLGMVEAVREAGRRLMAEHGVELHCRVAVHTDLVLIENGAVTGLGPEPGRTPADARRARPGRDQRRDPRARAGSLRVRFAGARRAQGSLPAGGGVHGSRRAGGARARSGEPPHALHRKAPRARAGGDPVAGHVRARGR